MARRLKLARLSLFHRLSAPWGGSDTLEMKFFGHPCAFYFNGINCTFIFGV
jgi:hypothetical protein